MNHLKAYCNLIRKAEKRGYTKNVDFYVEGHHIFPVSIFGKNNRIVFLTGREHYISHCLLEKIYIKRYGLRDEKTQKMINAHIMMKSGKYYNSHLYEGARRRFSNYIREKMTGHEVSEKTKNKISYHSSNRSEETLRKIGEASKGRIFSQEAREKMSRSGKGKKKPPGHGEKVSKAKKGKPSPLKGRIMPEEHKKKIGNSHAKTFYFINPEGNLTEIKNLQQYCKVNKLSRSYFYKLMRGEIDEYCGWKLNGTRVHCANDMAK